MVTLHSRDVWERNLCQCETCVCLSRRWGVWFINQWQGGKERCVGLVTTVRLKWCILLFFIWSLPRRSYFWLTCFLSVAGQSLKHPKGQYVPILCQLVIPGDAVGTQTLQDLQSTHLGKQKQAAKAVWELCLVCPSGQVETWSVLMLQWVGCEEIQNCLSVLEAFPAKTQEYIIGEDVEYIVLVSIAPLIQTLTEFALALDIIQGVLPLLWKL